MSASTRLCEVLLCVLLASACSKQPPRAEPARPVRVAVLADGAAGDTAEFAGEVRPRIESRLGFRVAGKITARLVDVGSAVKKGQVLMRLDRRGVGTAPCLSRES